MNTAAPGLPDDDPVAALIERLCVGKGFAPVGPVSAEAFAAGGDSVLLLLEDPRRAPEAFDLAVILPEILKALPGRLRPGVADLEFSRELAREHAIANLPALLFQREGGYVGVLEGLLDWASFLPAVAAMLDAPLSRRPGIGIPVRAAAPGGCH